MSANRPPSSKGRRLPEAIPKRGRSADLRPTAVDLFSGVGGLSLGLEQAGFDVVAALESDPIHAAAHHYNFPFCATVVADATTIDGTRLCEAILEGKRALRRSDLEDPKPFLVAGGPPCQGFSVGGKREANDERNALLFDYARLVAELEPSYFLLENVPGLLHPQNVDVLATALGILGAEGYVVGQPTVVDAADLGVPQRRLRVFVVGWREGMQPVDLSQLRRYGAAPSVADAIADLLPAVREATKAHAAGTAQITQARFPAGRSTFARALGRRAEGAAYPRESDGGTLRDLATTKHDPASARRFASTPKGALEPVSRYRRLDPRGVANTLRSGTGPDRGSFTPPRPIHYAEPRVITVREAARLHSFPDWFGFHATRWHAWREIGNAVPPRVGRRVGTAILRAAGLASLLPNRSISLGDPAELGHKPRHNSNSEYTG